MHDGNLHKNVVGGVVGAGVMSFELRYHAATAEHSAGINSGITSPKSGLGPVVLNSQSMWNAVIVDNSGPAGTVAGQGNNHNNADNLAGLRHRFMMHGELSGAGDSRERSNARDGFDFRPYAAATMGPDGNQTIEERLQGSSIMAM